MFPFDGGEKLIEEGDAGVLVVLGGVVSLAEEDGLEGGVGGEVGAGLADRLEVAVEHRRPLAPAVAEQAVVDLLAEAAHVGALGVGRESRVAVEGLHLRRHGVVFVGHDPVEMRA